MMRAVSFIPEDFVYSEGKSLTVRLVREIHDKLGAAQAADFIERNLPEAVKARIAQKKPVLDVTDEELPMVKQVVYGVSRRDFFRIGGQLAIRSGLVVAGSAVGYLSVHVPNPANKDRSVNIARCIMLGGLAVAATGALSNSHVALAEINERDATSEQLDASAEANAFIATLDPLLRESRATSRGVKARS